jgi:hypothetical protein
MGIGAVREQRVLIGGPSSTWSAEIPTMNCRLQRSLCLCLSATRQCCQNLQRRRKSTSNRQASIIDVPTSSGSSRRNLEASNRNNVKQCLSICRKFPSSNYACVHIIPQPSQQPIAIISAVPRRRLPSGFHVVSKSIETIKAAVQ